MYFIIVHVWMWLKSLQNHSTISTGAQKKPMQPRCDLGAETPRQPKSTKINQNQPNADRRRRGSWFSLWEVDFRCLPWSGSLCTSPCFFMLIHVLQMPCGCFRVMVCVYSLFVSAAFLSAFVALLSAFVCLHVSHRGTRNNVKVVLNRARPLQVG